MTGLKDIVNFVLPIPPSILMRNGEFPNCTAIFEKISKNPPNPRELGRIFSRLCSLSGFSWLVWSFNTITFCVVVIMLLYHWGNKLDMSEPSYFGFLSCQMVVSILAATLFVGKIIFFGVTTIALQLSDRCNEHISNDTTSVGTSRKKK